MLPMKRLICLSLIQLTTTRLNRGIALYYGGRAKFSAR